MFADESGCRVNKTYVAQESTQRDISKILAVLALVSSMASCSTHAAPEDGLSKSWRNRSARPSPLPSASTLPTGTDLPFVDVGGSGPVAALAGAQKVDGVVASGNGPLEIGLGSKAGGAVSGGSAELDPFSVVAGNVTTGSGLTSDPTAVVTGSIQTFAPVPPSTRSWSTTSSGNGKGSLLLLPGQSVTVAPGDCSTISAPAASTVTFPAGTYFVQESQPGKEPLAFVVDSRNGPVFLYVTVSLTCGAIETSVGTGAPQLFVGYAGILPVLVNSPFQGVLLAPNAAVVLEPLQTHSATFYGPVRSKSSAMPSSTRRTSIGASSPASRSATIRPGRRPQRRRRRRVRQLAGHADAAGHDAGATHMTASTVDSFIDWAGAAAQGQIPELESRVAAAASDPAVLAALTARLLAIPAGQVSDVAAPQLIIMSILGQMKNWSADAALVTFIGNDPVCGVPASDAGPSDAGEQGIPDTVADTGSLLRAKAVEMLAFIGDELALQATLNIAATHACKAVRIAAIDAYMFNNADSSAAKSQLMAVVHADEQKNDPVFRGAIA